MLMRRGVSLALDQLRLPGAPVTQTPPPANRPPHHGPGEKFLKGPIPWDWLTVAARQPGKTLHVAIELWRWAGIKRTGVIRLSLSRAAREFDTSRSALSRGLRALEAAGLVSVTRKAGSRLTVTLLDAHHAEDPSGPPTNATASAAPPNTNSLSFVNSHAGASDSSVLPEGVTSGLLRG